MCTAGGKKSKYIQIAPNIELNNALLNVQNFFFVWNNVTDNHTSSSPHGYFIGHLLLSFKC